MNLLLLIKVPASIQPNHVRKKRTIDLGSVQNKQAPILKNRYACKRLGMGYLNNVHFFVCVCVYELRSFEGSYNQAVLHISKNEYTNDR